MHTQQIVELAALVASHGPTIIRGSLRASDSSSHEYWTASKCRLDRWREVIADPIHRPNLFVPTLEELFVSEILTRVWSAIARGFDLHHDSTELEPVAASIFVGHMEARHRALKLVLTGRFLSEYHATQLNRLRRRCERWTDVLLAYVGPPKMSHRFAHDSNRLEDFAESIGRPKGRPKEPLTWPLVLATMKESFSANPGHSSPNSDLNQRIASGILACFGPDIFDSSGQFQSLWQWRIFHAASDTQGMIEGLLAADDESRQPWTHARNRPTRLGEK
ncbi:MAG: hypothetical protein R3E01_09060 [Pirellulaceae bacterium]